MANIFPRPEITDEMRDVIKKAATLIVINRSRPTIIAYVVLLLAENVRLLEEVNLHRNTLGYDLLEKFDPKF
jgi:hypothetical protein